MHVEHEGLIASRMFRAVMCTWDRQRGGIASQIGAAAWTTCDSVRMQRIGIFNRGSELVTRGLPLGTWLRE